MSILRKVRFVLLAGLCLGTLSCSSEPPPRLLVIGLDGATWDLVDPWIKEGKLPNLAALRARSAWGTMNSVIPYLSPPAWTSAVTGMNPGTHGVFDFQRRLPGDNKVVTYTAKQRRAQPIWNILKGQGPKVCVVNVPLTDPYDEVDGVMVSGFPHQGIDYNWVWPESRLDEIKDMGYLKDRMEMQLPEGGEAALLDSLMLIQEKRFELAKKLYAEDRYDLFWVVFTQTDRVQHLFWKFDDPENPNYDPELAARFGGSIEKLWLRCDELLGELLAVVDPESWILVLSDHGFGPIRREFRVANYLQTPQSGLTPSEQQDVMTLDKSDAARLYLRELAKDPGGTRDGEQLKELRSKLIESLKAAVDPETGKHPVSEIFDKDALFVGMHAETGPDVVVLPEPTYYMAYGDTDDASLEPFGPLRTSLSGWHHMDGVFMLAGPAVKSGRVSNAYSLLDVVPTCLYLMDRSIPRNLHGKVMENAMDPGFFQANQPRSGSSVGGEDREMTQEEKDALGNIPYVGG